MPKPMKINPTMARIRREKALRREELRQPTDERVPSAGVTSFAQKAEDPQTRAMIDKFLAERNPA